MNFSKLFKNSSLGFLFILFASLHIVQCAVLGIDFGQEYTKASLVAPGAPFELVMTSDSKRKDLSGLTFKKLPGSGTFERVYGNSASAFIQRFPGTSPFYLKPLLGESLDSHAAKWYSKQFPAVELVPSKNNRSTIAINLFGDLYSVEEVIAMSFTDIKGRASKLLSQAMSGSSGYIKDIALTVPPHYTVQQRKALQDVVEISDLRLISLINDGVAVAVNLASMKQLEDNQKEYHIIYDIGAGSTCATLVEFYQAEIVPKGSTLPRSTTVIDVLGVGYDTELGGHVLTQSVRDILIEKFLEANPKVDKNELLKDARALARFWREAERVKFVLSANSDTHSSIESAYNDISLKTHVTRVEFERANMELFDRVSQPILTALDNSFNNSEGSFNFSSVSSIILTGGSTRIPLVQQELQALISSRDPTDSVILAKNVNADEAAVLGTTLRGVGISKIFKSKDMVVIDRVLWDYAVEIDGISTIVFPRGTPLDNKFILPLDTDKNELTISLLENDKQFIKHDIVGIQSTISRLLNDQNRECISNITVDAEFQLSNSRVFELVGVYARCNSVDKVVSTTESSSSTFSISTESTDDASPTSGNSAESVSSTPSTSESVSSEFNSESSNVDSKTTPSPTPKPPKMIRRPITVKTSYDGPRPMGSASKQNALSRLRALDKLDADRLAKEEYKNIFESRLYRVREILESEEEAQLRLSKISEWFDDESESATMKELKEKLEELNSLADSFEKSQQGEDAQVLKQPTEAVPPPYAEQQPLKAADKLSDLYQGAQKVADMLQDLGIELPNKEAVDKILGEKSAEPSSNLQGIADLLRSKLQSPDVNGDTPIDTGNIEARLNELRDMIKKAADVIKTETPLSSSPYASTSSNPVETAGYVPKHEDL